MWEGTTPIPEEPFDGDVARQHIRAIISALGNVAHDAEMLKCKPATRPAGESLKREHDRMRLAVRQLAQTIRVEY